MTDPLLAVERLVKANEAYVDAYAEAVVEAANGTTLEEVIKAKARLNVAPSIREEQREAQLAFDRIAWTQRVELETALTKSHAASAASHERLANLGR